MARLASGEYYGASVGTLSVRDALLTRLQHAAGRRLPPHTHERAYYALLLRGGYRESHRSASLESVPSSLVFHPPATTHADEIAPSGGLFFIIELGDSWLGRNRQSPIRERPELVGDALALYRAHQSGAVPDLEAEERLWSLAATDTRSESGTPTWLRRVVARLHDEPAEPHTVTSLAAEANVHPVHLSRTFRARLGMTAGEYLHRLRMAVVTRELARGQSLIDVAYAAGFADQSHMSRICRAMVGATPGELRRLLERG